MEIVMASVLRWPVFTGSWPAVFAVTLVLTIPAAWLLHRWTRPHWVATDPPEGGRRDRSERQLIQASGSRS
jgi:hypothetical protein